MNELHQSIRRALNGLVDERAERGNWTRVLADAERGDRRAWVMRVAVVAAAAVVIVGAALVSPFEDEQSTGVIDRALAAIGEGPVLHVVFRGDYGTSFLELRTGKVTPIYGDVEVWYDADRGAHYVSRFGGVVSDERSIAPSELAESEVRRYQALAARYREALESGRARVVAPGRVGDRKVHWIRLRGEWRPDRQDGQSHLHAEEIAVDGETYEPVFVRRTLDGKPFADWSGDEILELELLPEGEGDFTGESPRQGDQLYFSQRFGRGLDRARMARLLPGGGLWVGPSFSGLPFADARELIMTSRVGPGGPRKRTVAASVFYGPLRRGHRDASRHHVVIEQAREFPPEWGWRPKTLDVPEGSALVRADRSAFLRQGQREILIRGRNTRNLVAAAVSLRPFGTNEAMPTGLNVNSIAEEIERDQIARVEGFAPVQPRPLVLRRGKQIQSGQSRGVTVAIYSGGIARVDTTGMDERLRRVLRRTLPANCFRVTNGVGGSGVGGSVPTEGVKDVVLLAQPQHGRMPVLRGRFDACEISTGLGRNWLRRYAWHGLFEVPLTQRGVRFFDNRAAARRARADRN
jgi:hypothetical protein